MNILKFIISGGCDCGGWFHCKKSSSPHVAEIPKKEYIPYDKTPEGIARERKWLAINAMYAGMRNNPHSSDFEAIAKDAVKAADALLSELEKPQ